MEADSPRARLLRHTLQQQSRLPTALLELVVQVRPHGRIEADGERVEREAPDTAHAVRGDGGVLELAGATSSSSG